MGGTMLAFAILAALLARERLGVGQKVESSLLGGMIWLQGINIAMQLMNGTSMHSRNRAAGDALNNWYRCQDDMWIAIATPQSDRHWPELIEIFGRSELGEDPRFLTHMTRFNNNEDLVAILDAIFRTRTREEWMQRFREGSIPFAPVNEMADVVRDPQVVENGYVTSFVHEVLGDIKMLGFPVRFSETPFSLRRRAPEHGEHTEEVLTEVLGLDWDQIGHLRDKGTI
jgi:crotonobetainyl-CoA:carnitine CoA-transferase CaiB-like acyl-CoA transferase